MLFQVISLCNERKSLIILNNRCWQLGESGLGHRLLRPLQRQLLLRDHGGKDFFLPTLTGLCLDAVIRAPAGYRLAAAPARQRADSTPKILLCSRTPNR